MSKPGLPSICIAFGRNQIQLTINWKRKDVSDINEIVSGEVCKFFLKCMSFRHTDCTRRMTWPHCGSCMLIPVRCTAIRSAQCGDSVSTWLLMCPPDSQLPVLCPKKERPRWRRVGFLSPSIAATTHSHQKSFGADGSCTVSSVLPLCYPSIAFRHYMACTLTGNSQSLMQFVCSSDTVSEPICFCCEFAQFFSPCKSEKWTKEPADNVDKNICCLVET